MPRPKVLRENTIHPTLGFFYQIAGCLAEPQKAVFCRYFSNRGKNFEIG